MDNTTTTVKTDTQPKLSQRGWPMALFLSFVALPIVAFLCVCAYGFIVWFGQILFWGPPH